MGQYFLIVNLDKKEFLLPHTLGSGLKIGEIVHSGVASVLPYLLYRSSDDSMAQIYDSKHGGHWAGDRIIVVGDYDDSKLYDEAQDNFKDISEEVRKEFEEWSQIKLPERW